MKIIGIDPGYATIGWGVVDYRASRFTTLGYGAIITPPKTPFPSRLEQIAQELEQLLLIYRPDSMSIERLFFAANKTTGIDVAQARGVILLGAQKQRIPVFEYTPVQVKKSVTGYGGATKAQMMEMTKRILHLKELPKPDDTADALAMAVAHAHSASSLLYGMNQ